MKILFFAVDPDEHCQDLARNLRSMGNTLGLFTIPGTTPPPGIFDRVVTDPDEAKESYELAYAVFDSSKRLPRLSALMLERINLPLVVDGARLPLVRDLSQEQSCWEPVLDKAIACVVRDKLQQRFFTTSSCSNVLMSSDYLRFSFLPRMVATDIAWLFASLLGKTWLAPPPSRLMQHVLAPPRGDKQAGKQARELLRIDPLCYPALLRLGMLQGEQPSAEHQRMQLQASRADKFSWLHEISLLEHAREGTPLYSQLVTLKQHVFPPRSKQGIKRILLVVVYRQRDFFLDILLRFHLERLGYEVIMRPLGHQIKDSIVELVPDAIIWGAKTTPYQIKLARFAKDRGIISIVRREEGVVFSKLWEERDKDTKSLTLGITDYSPFVELEMGSNSTFRYVISQEGHMPSSRCLAVGAMQFDSYLEPAMDNVARDRENLFQELGLDHNKKLVVMATAWSYADRDPRTAVPEAKALENKAQDIMARTVEASRTGRKEWKVLIESFCRDYATEWNVLIKVHPGEKIEAYQDFINERYLPAKVIQGGYMREILPHADLLINAGSTTSLEAHCLGVPTIAYWIDPTIDHPLYKLTEYANDYEKFKTIFQDMTFGESNMLQGAMDFVTKEFYGTFDGHGCKRAAEAIDELLYSVPHKPFRYPEDTPVPYVDPIEDDYGTLITQEEVIHYYTRLKVAKRNQDATER